MKLFRFKKKVEYTIPEGMQESLREIQEERDKNENEQTQPPENEQINIRCIWVVEIYPPSHIKNLLSCIEKFNWNNPLPNHNVSKWIEENRQGSFGSCFYLNYIKNTKTVMNRFAPIPEGFDGAFGTILQLIPSTTLFIMQFIVNSETEQILEKPLNEEYKTYVESHNKTHSFISPTHQKQLAIENTRKFLYDKCFEWFKSNAPGIFSCRINEGIFPTIEFVTLNAGKPFVDSTHSEYLRMLGLCETAYVWQCNDLPGVLLGVPLNNENKYSRLFLSGNFSEIFADEDNHLMGHEKNTFGLSIALEYRLIKEIGLWSSYVLIKAYESQFSVIRDKLVLINLKPIDRAVEKIRQMENNFLEIEKDTSYFTNELSYYCDTNNFSHKYINFQPINSWISKNNFFDNTRIKIINEIEYLKELQKNIRQVIDVFSQNISTLSNERVAKTNINIQKCMMILTVAILLLAIVTGWNQIIQIFK